MSVTPRDETGSALIEFLLVGLLLLVPVLYIALAVLRVQAAGLASTQAVRQAARAFVVADDTAVGRRAADTAVRVALEDQGFQAAPGAVSIRCEPGCLAPGSLVQVRLAWAVDLPWLPEPVHQWLPSVPITTVHEFGVDDYRSGLAG